MAFGRAAGLHVALTDWNSDGLSIAGSRGAAFYDRVKAILPQTIVFFPLSLDESQSLAFADDSLASRVTFDGPMLSAPGGLRLWSDAAD